MPPFSCRSATTADGANVPLARASAGSLPRSRRSRDNGRPLQHAARGAGGRGFGEPVAVRVGSADRHLRHRALSLVWYAFRMQLPLCVAVSTKLKTRSWLLPTATTVVASLRSTITYVDSSLAGPGRPARSGRVSRPPAVVPYLS